MLPCLKFIMKKFKILQSILLKDLKADSKFAKVNY